MAKVKRVYARLPEDFYKDFERYAEKFGLTIAQFAGMCIQAGYMSIVRSIAPEEVISDENLSRIVSAMASVLSRGSEVRDESNVKTS